MIFLADIHGYPPHHNSGAEWMAHYVFRHLVKAGNRVVVLLNFTSHLGHVKEPYIFEGVEVVSDAERARYYQTCDAVFTHLNKTGKAYNWCSRYKKPLFHFIHNNYKNIVAEKMNAIDQYAIYNSQWVSDDVEHGSIVKSIVLHPPVTIEDYETERINNYITMINVNPNKGGEILIQLARKMPEYKFMGVMGSYGEQKVDHSIKNIFYINHTGDIKQAYKRTRVLIMPSAYESYGRTAVEAACSGIPVICTPTPGLKEAMSSSAIYVERDDIEGWISAIKSLDDKENYAEASEKCYLRAKSLDPSEELKNLINFIHYEICST